MVKRRATQHLRCPKCRINQRLCFCEHISPIKLDSKVTMIMHFAETHLPTNTAQLAQQCLTNSQLIIRGKENQPISDHFSIDEYHPLFLYPDEEAVELTPELVMSINKPIQLIVPDGTWKQAKKIKRREPIFENIQSVKLPYLGGSIYTLRKQKYHEGLCTFEAIAKSLKIIENEETEKHLMTIFKVMVERFEISRKGTTNRFDNS